MHACALKAMHAAACGTLCRTAHSPTRSPAAQDHASALMHASDCRPGPGGAARRVPRLREAGGGGRTALLDWAAAELAAEGGPHALRALLAVPNSNGALPAFTATHFCVPEVVAWLLCEGRVGYDALLAPTRKGKDGRMRACGADLQRSHAAALRLRAAVLRLHMHAGVHACCRLKPACMGPAWGGCVGCDAAMQRA